MTEPTQSADAAGDTGHLELFEGTASGGPLDGGRITARRPAGVLLVDRPAGRVWRYALRMGNLFVNLDGDAGRVLDEGTDSRERAADEGLWDVQAAPWIGDPDTVDVEQPDADVVDQGDEDEVPPASGQEITGPIDEGV